MQRGKWQTIPGQMRVEFGRAGEWGGGVDDMRFSSWFCPRPAAAPDMPPARPAPSMRAGGNQPATQRLARRSETFCSPLSITLRARLSNKDGEK